MATGFLPLDLFMGYQQSKQLANQAQAARTQAEMARIQGTETAAASRDQLRMTLGNIDAIRSARGVSLDSPTAQVIGQQAVGQSDANYLAQQLAFSTQAASSSAQAAGYNYASRWAIPLAGAEGIIHNANAIAGAYGGGG